jgi:AcrR family transcriptional regulator
VRRFNQLIENLNLSIHNGLMTRTRLKKKRKTRPSPVTPGATSAREILLREAKHLFARKGLSGTSIRDIALAAKMNSSQISYYFESKEGLYRACVADIAQSRTAIAEQILTPPASAEEYRIRLRLYAENLIAYFLEDRDTGLIIIREYDRTHSPAEKIFKLYFERLFELLMAFFAVAVRQGFAPRKSDPMILASLYFGMLMSELRLDHIKYGLFRRSLRDSAERSKVIDQIVALMVG